MTRSTSDKSSESDASLHAGRLAIAVSTLLGVAVLGLRFLSQMWEAKGTYGGPAPTPPGRSGDKKPATNVSAPTASAPVSKAPASKPPTSKPPTAKAPTAKAPTAKAPTAKAPTAEPADPKNSAEDALDLDAVLERLDRRRQRATYGAVAGIAGRLPINVMRGRNKEPRHSWVVNQKTGEPTNYPPSAVHPELKKNAHVIDDTDELRAWFRGNP